MVMLCQNVTQLDISVLFYEHQKTQKSLEIQSILRLKLLKCKRELNRKIINYELILNACPG